MSARCHRIANLGTGNHRANRETTTKAFGNGDNIRADARGFIGKQCAGTPDAGLHLIGNYQRTKFIGSGPHTPQIVIMRVTRATFSLNRFDHHRRHMRTKGIPQRIQVAKGDMVKSVRHRTKAGAVGLFVCCGQHTKRAPVKGPGRAQDGCPLCLSPLKGRPACNFHRAFIGLCA